MPGVRGGIPLARRSDVRFDGAAAAVTNAGIAGQVADLHGIISTGILHCDELALVIELVVPGVTSYGDGSGSRSRTSDNLAYSLHRGVEFAAPGKIGVNEEGRPVVAPD